MQPARAFGGLLLVAVLSGSLAAPQHPPALNTTAAALSANRTGLNLTALNDTAKLDEFKSASKAAAVPDPGDDAAACRVKPQQLGADDLDAVKKACDTAKLAGAANTAGSPYCHSCGCALTLLPYKPLSAAGAFKNNTSGAKDAELDAWAQVSFQVAANKSAVSKESVAALRICAPIDFVCKQDTKTLNTSMLVPGTEDQVATLASGVHDAVQEAAADATPMSPPVRSAAGGAAAGALGALAGAAGALVALLAL